MSAFRAARPTPLARTLAALSVTQLIGWGTTYYLPALLAKPMSAATGVPIELVFGGVTVMLLASAALAPIAGRRLQRSGAGPWMALGSLATALGLATLAFAGSPLSFALAWLIMGAGAPLSLSQAASTAIVQASPAGGARRGLTILLLFTGLASTASWPVLIAFDGWFGWRTSVLAYALVHVLVCAPLHLWLLPRGPIAPGAATPAAALPAGAPEEAGKAPAGEVAGRPVAGGFGLAAVAFSTAGFITYGLPLHVISVLEDYGHTRAAAVALGTLLGPGQLLARLLDIFGGHRIEILTVGLAAALLMPVALTVMWIAGAERWAAIAFTLGYGVSAGLMSIVRAVAPLRLFGRAAYASVLGRLSVPLNIAFAFSPLVLAAVRARAGSEGLLAVVMVAALTSLATLVLLRRRALALLPS